MNETPFFVAAASGMVRYRDPVFLRLCIPACFRSLSVNICDHPSIDPAVRGCFSLAVTVAFIKVKRKAIIRNKDNQILAAAYSGPCSMLTVLQSNLTCH